MSVCLHSTVMSQGSWQGEVGVNLAYFREVLRILGGCEGSRARMTGV